jgi:nitroimidazol reductase NimA-like FMN-containing flavoprotein (pyridoxamine 5'-phosphate oxidase superfamily)
MNDVETFSEEVLDRDTCRALLASRGVGRLAVCTAGWGPVIRPVSYAYDWPSQSIVFRSGRGSKLTAVVISGAAAFEVDDVDEAGDCAWSVIATGIAELVVQSQEIARLEDLPIRLWAPGEKPAWVRIRPQQLSGRRLSPTPDSRG